MTVRFSLNGQVVEVNEIDPHVTLLTWLRASGLSGSKEGCAEGECGACAVALVDRDAHGQACFTSINSCLVPLPALHGRTLVSVEGVADAGGALHPVQRALVECGGSQCGYCTPGFVVSLFCEYYRPGRTGYDPEAISGNLCRCTGYRPIADAARALPFPEANDPRLVQLRAKDSQPMAASYEHAGAGSIYLHPESLAELFEQLAAHPDATLIAGGTDLMVYRNQRYQRFGVLIALDGLRELRRFARNEHEIVLGAGLPLSQIEAHLEHDCPEDAGALRQLLPLFSSRLIRNRATLGGNLGTASPIGDSPPALLVLDAELSLRSASGVRRVPLREFFVGYRQHVLTAGEVIESVHLPRPLPRTQRFYKVSKRPLDDISTVAGAFALDVSSTGRVERLRVAYGGVAATPLRAYAVEQLAVGKPWTLTTLDLLLGELESLATPLSDHRGSAAYRRAMIGKLLEKFFSETHVRAEAAE